MSSVSSLKPIKSHRTFKEETVHVITRGIFSGKIKPGERLNESDLARQLGVSRSPVREALQQLQDQGLIVAVRRHGMAVVSLSNDDVRKINILRVILEAEALLLARQRATDRDREELAEIVDRMEQMQSEPALEQVHIDIEFHRAIWELSGNEHLSRVLNSLTTPLFAHALLHILRRKDPRLVLLSHRPLLEFVQNKSKDEPHDLMRAHLSLSWDTYMSETASLEAVPSLAEGGQR